MNWNSVLWVEIKALDQAASVFLSSVFILNFQGLKIFFSYSILSDAATHEIRPLCGMEEFQNRILKCSSKVLFE